MLFVARNAVTVLLAGVAYWLFLYHGLSPFTASNQIPAGLPPFELPDFTLYSPADNRTITTAEIFRVSDLYKLYTSVYYAQQSQKVATGYANNKIDKEAVNIDI